MSEAIGFVLLTHDRPEQAARLVRRLTTMFDAPPIAWHHDFSKCDLSSNEWPGNVTFIEPHMPTSWAAFSVVQGTLTALRRLLHSGTVPEWIVLLSGADYPIKPAGRILSDLQGMDCDACIAFQPVSSGKDETHWWPRLCYDRYCARSFMVPCLSRGLQPIRRRIILRHPLLCRTPFNDGFICYAGSQWFTISRRAAEMMLDFHEGHPELAAHYAPRSFAEESFFQTILANMPGLKLCNRNLRYTDWSAGGPHPATLCCRDLPSLTASDAHFARKFDIHTDSLVLDELDRIIDGQAPLRSAEGGPEEECLQS